MLACNTPPANTSHPLITSLIHVKELQLVIVTRITRLRFVYEIYVTLQQHTATNSMSNYTTYGNISTRMQFIVVCLRTTIRVRNMCTSYTYHEIAYCVCGGWGWARWTGWAGSGERVGRCADRIAATTTNFTTTTSDGAATNATDATSANNAATNTAATPGIPHERIPHSQPLIREIHSSITQRIDLDVNYSPYLKNTYPMTGHMDSQPTNTQSDVQCKQSPTGYLAVCNTVAFCKRIEVIRVWAAGWVWVGVGGCG